MKELTVINVNAIKDNPLNQRSMEPDQISILAESILKDTLMQPPIVYKEGEDYVLLAGHRRIAALKMIKAKKVRCYVVDKPVDQADEIEYMTKGNFHRNDPKEIQNEYRIAANNWDTMPSKRRKDIQETLLKSFEERNKTNPAYIENKKEFLKNRFRPKYEYIRSITGLEVSNSTIKNQIKEETIETDTVDEKEETNKSKVVTGKKVVKAATTLLGLLDLYEPYEEELGVIEDAINALNDLVDGMMTE